MKIFRAKIEWVDKPGEEFWEKVLITDYVLSEAEQGWIEDGEEIPIAADGEYRDSDIFYYGLTEPEIIRLVAINRVQDDFRIKEFELEYEGN